MALSGFGQTDPAQKQAGVQRIIGPGSGKTEPARFQFPASDSDPFFHRRPESDCAKPARVRLGSGWPYQVVAKRIRSGRKPVCKNHRARFWQNGTGPDLIWLRMAISGCGQTYPFRKQADMQEYSGPVPANGIRAGSSMFTGRLFDGRQK